MLLLFLLLHVIGAIVVFGPTFVFPLIGSQAQKSPQNGHFAAALTELIERRIVLPGAVVQGITGGRPDLYRGQGPDEPGQPMACRRDRAVSRRDSLPGLRPGAQCREDGPPDGRWTASRRAARRRASWASAGDRRDEQEAPAGRDVPDRLDRPDRHPDGDQAGVLRSPPVRPNDTAATMRVDCPGQETSTHAARRRDPN